MKYIDRFVEQLGSLLFWMILILVNLQIVFRFVLRISVPWTEEISRMIFVYLAFIGAAISVRKGEMIIVDTVPNMIQGTSKKILNATICVFNLFLSIVMFSASTQMMLVAWPTTLSTVRWMSNGMLYTPLVFSFAIMAIHFAGQLIRMVLRKEAA